ncbi:MAG: RluA family pseudouridine synthase [Planctomycetota bacterium]|jgi:23S rRNA pseudouridine1911/1915/1917 synthase|nr:RluA family pseudouridine synthase [Planctomycetota bacterium]
MPIFTAPGEVRLLDFLRDMLPEWRPSTIKGRLREGRILVNGVQRRSGATELRAGDKIELAGRAPGLALPPGLGEPPLPLLYFDDRLLAIDKPSGLLSVASERERRETAVRIMRDWLGVAFPDRRNDLHVAHRLDRDASGVLLFARSLELKRRLAGEWHACVKEYLALVDGVPDPREGRIDFPLWEDKGLFVRVDERGGGTPAETFYRTARTKGGRSLVGVRLGTGRRHQIRVHLAAIGCPIVGDSRYGKSRAPRLALHAARLTLANPVDGVALAIEAPTPEFFRRGLARRNS